MKFSLKSIEKIIEHLKDLTPKDRASVVDHLFIIMAGVLLFKESFFGPSFTDMQGMIGPTFTPYVTFGLCMSAIFGSLYGCNVIVHRLSKYD